MTIAMTIVALFEALVIVWCYRRIGRLMRKRVALIDPDRPTPELPTADEVEAHAIAAESLAEEVAASGFGMIYSMWVGTLEGIRFHELRDPTGWVAANLSVPITELGGDRWHKHIHPDDLARTTGAIMQSSGFVINRYRDTEGEWIWLKWTWAIQPNGLGFTLVRRAEWDALSSDLDRILARLERHSRG